MKIYNKLIKIYLDKYKNNKYFNIISIFFDIFILKKYSVKEKYKFLGNSLDNVFLTKDITFQIFSIFSQIQKKYFALLRFKYILLYKKSKIVVDNDLSLNPISEKDKNIVVINQKNKKYLFHIKDLLHIINSSIGHSDYFFSSPISVKNPYNNAIFTKSILYNIYFFMKFNTLYFSELFHHFFICNFDLSEFFGKNTILLRNYSIKDYLKNSTEENLLLDIEEMMDDFNYDNKNYKILIDPEFPNKKLLEILKPYVNLYIYSKFSYLNSEKNNAQKLLTSKLKQFYTFNPSFGRKIIKINNDFNKKNNPEIEFIFLEDYLPIHKNNTNYNEFLNSHTSIKLD
jgi:hypothetical protein